MVSSFGSYFCGADAVCSIKIYFQILGKIMNKLIIFISLLLLSGCVAGDFGEERNRLYEMNSDKEICGKMPERCINGVSW